MCSKEFWAGTANHKYCTEDATADTVPYLRNFLLRRMRCGEDKRDSEQNIHKKKKKFTATMQEGRLTRQVCSVTDCMRT